MNSDDIVSIAKILFYPLIAAAFIVGFIAMLVMQNKRRKEHTAAMKAFAAQNGWRFDEFYDFPFLRELAHYAGKIEKGIFGMTIENPLLVSSKNVIQGKWNGHNFAVLEQTYTRGNSKNRYDVTQTLFAAELKDLRLPIFCLEPDDSPKFLFWNFKGIDIDFQTHPHFSRVYKLYGQSESQIRSLFQPTVLSFYERNPLFTTIGGGRYLVIYQHGRVFEPFEIISQLDFLFALVSAFKFR